MSSRSLNKVMLIGNLTRDPELRYTPQGTPVCTFGLATNRSWLPSGGERQEETEFHRIVAWQKLAELCSQLLFKGRKVYVEGRLQTRRWTAPDGQERVTTEIVIDDMIILDSRHKGEETLEGASSEPSSQPVVSETAPTKTASKSRSKTKEKSEKEEKAVAPKEENQEQPAEELSEKDINDIPF